MLIGLMGKSGSGKSLVSMLFKEINENIQIIDVDKIGHMSHNDLKVKEKLKEYFGNEIFNEDFSINRIRLSEVVFKDYSKVQLLYDATYEYMVYHIDKLITSGKIIVLDYALLPLTKYYELCDLKILVESSIKLRRERVQKRDKISKEKYDLRDKNSVDYSNFVFDYTIYNTSDIENLRKAVKSVYEKSVISGKF